MFNKKQSLFDVPVVAKTAKAKGFANGFLSAGMKKGAETQSENGAVKYSNTDCPFVTEFGSCAAFKAPRSYADIEKSMSTLWATDPLTCVKFTLYLRMVTRKTVAPDGSKTETVQRGQGLKHEAIMRMVWLGINHPEIFKKNLPVFISVGSWKDVFQMLRADLTFNGWKGRLLDWDYIKEVIHAGLSSESQCELVKKYLPTIRAKSKCHTPEAQANHIIGAWIADSLDAPTKTKGYKKYRQTKSSGTAHAWQQAISQQKPIDFNTVAGRALSKLVNGKYLANQDLEKEYEKWIAAQPVAKYTGYPYELFADYTETRNYLTKLRPMKQHEIHTVNKQFMGLVETAKKDATKNTSLLVVRDTSASMNGVPAGSKFSAGLIAKSMALYFSYMLPEGHFSDSWIEFNRDAKMHKWVGSTPVEKWQTDSSSFVGSTDFLSVIRLFGNIKNTGVAESEFPSGIICISDGEFNRAGGLTNAQHVPRLLTEYGFSKEYVDNFQLVLWDIPSWYGHGSKFETYESDTPNCFQFSGYDPAVIAFLTGEETKEESKVTPKTPAELFARAMDQEILGQVEV